MNCLVFSNNIWVSVPIPKGHDPSWTQADSYYYATSYTVAKEKGFSEKQAVILAEALVSKRLYPGLVYDKCLEQDLLNLNTPPLAQ